MPVRKRIVTTRMKVASRKNIHRAHLIRVRRSEPRSLGRIARSRERKVTYGRH